jgi:hypothetical protein
MNYREIKKLVDKHLKPFFVDNGFTNVKTDTWGFGVYKEDNSGRYQFGTRKLNYGHVLLQFGRCKILFNEVESAIKGIAGEHNFEMGGCTYGEYDNSENAISKVTFISETKITDEESFKIYAEKFKTYCSEMVFPFFQKYSDLKNIAAFVETLDYKENLCHFGGEFPINAFKSMYISYNYGNRNKYEGLKKYIIEGIEWGKDQEQYKERAEIDILAFKKFTNKLENELLKS